MKSFVKIFLIGAISFFASCTDHKKTKQVLSVAENSPVITTPMPSVAETVSPCDTLNFLDLEILLSFQKDFDFLFQEILPYALSAEMRLVRNELFARKGYRFKDTILLDYFTCQDWYLPKYSSLDSITLTSNEKALVDTLLRYEKLNAHLTRKSFQQLFLNEYLEELNSSHDIPIVLWTQAIYQNQPNNLPPHPWNYAALAYENTTMSSAPWDYMNAYSIILVDKPYGYYHCILSYYCGAEGCNCYSDFVYVLDKGLNVLDFKRFDGCFSIDKVADNKYDYSVSKGDFEDITEVERGFYEINKEGLIYLTTL